MPTKAMSETTVRTMSRPGNHAFDIVDKKKKSSCGVFINNREKVIGICETYM